MANSGQENLSYGPPLVASGVGILVILALGLITEASPAWTGILTRGVSLSTQVLGVIASVGSLLKGAQVLAIQDATYRDVGAVAVTAIAGGILVYVGSLVAA
jgi:hypothetical protein